MITCTLANIFTNILDGKLLVEKSQRNKRGKR